MVNTDAVSGSASASRCFSSCGARPVCQSWACTTSGFVRDAYAETAEQNNENRRTSSVSPYTFGRPKSFSSSKKRYRTSSRLSSRTVTSTAEPPNGTLIAEPFPIPHFARSMVPYSGSATATSCPSDRSACGSEPTTSASPPTFANGATSAEAKRIFNDASCYLFPLGAAAYRSASKLALPPSGIDTGQRRWRESDVSSLEPDTRGDRRRRDGAPVQRYRAGVRRCPAWARSGS